MYNAIKFKETFEKYSDRPVLLYGDPDVDGLISLLLMCQFCEMVGRRYQYYVNADRYHGLSIQASAVKGYLILAADFAISAEEMQFLVSNDVVVLSTDHHEVQDSFISVESQNSEGFVWNNQYPFEPEEDRYLSGAGVFYELVCSLYPEFKSKERSAMVGITLLSDVCPIENKKARQYLRTLYGSDCSEGYAKYLIDSTVDTSYGFGAPKLDRNFVDFTLSPYINAMLRANKTSEAVNFILGFGKVDKDCRSVQKEVVRAMTARAQICPFPGVTYLVVNTSDFVDFWVDIASYIGLFCSDYKDKHGNVSTLGIVIDNGKIKRVSFRGKYDDIPYRSSFIALGYKAGGHPNAFGLREFAPTEETWQQISDVVSELEQDHHPTYKVIQTGSLAMTLLRKGSLAMDNCYVRDMYRTYIQYTGENVKEITHTYRMRELTEEDLYKGVKPEIVSRGHSYVYERDSNNQPITKYIEYLVDGRKVKSFGVSIEDGLILPVLEKGYLALYVRGRLE